jgi:hypothetical protein
MQFSGEQSECGVEDEGLRGVKGCCEGGDCGCWEVAELANGIVFEMVTRSSRCIDSARPMTSKPGPGMNVNKRPHCPSAGSESIYRYWLMSTALLRRVSNE